MRRALVVVLTAVLVAVPVAEAGVFEGRTSQDRSAELRTNDRRLPVHVRIAWRASCSRGIFRETTSFLPPYDVRSAREVRDAGAYTLRDGDLRYRIRTHVRARRVAPRRWRGTFGATGTITWRASR